MKALLAGFWRLVGAKPDAVIEPDTLRPVLKKLKQKADKKRKG